MNLIMEQCPFCLLYIMYIKKETASTVSLLTVNHRINIYGKHGVKDGDKTVQQKRLMKWGDQEVKDAWVVNASGTLIKSKNKCKDGDDYIINVDNYKIQEIYEELD